MSRDPKPTVEELRPLLQILMNEANNWYSASKRCFADIPLSPNISQSLTNPAVVSNAFSIELYIKALLISSGMSPAYHHNNHEHFMSLPEDIREKAARRFGACGCSESLQQYIEKNRNWFLDFRYIYEAVAKAKGQSVSILPGFNLNHYWAATRALHNTLIEIVPSLKIPGESSHLFNPGQSPY